MGECKVGKTQCPSPLSILSHNRYYQHLAASPGLLQRRPGVQGMVPPLSRDSRFLREEAQVNGTWGLTGVKTGYLTNTLEGREVCQGEDGPPDSAGGGGGFPRGNEDQGG